MSERIENADYTGPWIEIDRRKTIKTWPLFAGPRPEQLTPGWMEPVPDEPLPRRVFPAPLTDPALEVQP